METCGSLPRLQRGGSLVQVTVAFERLNRDGERLLLTVEGTDAAPEMLEALLLPVAATVRLPAIRSRCQPRPRPRRTDA